MPRILPHVVMEKLEKHLEKPLSDDPFGFLRVVMEPGDNGWMVTVNLRGQPCRRFSVHEVKST